MHRHLVKDIQAYARSGPGKCAPRIAAALLGQLRRTASDGTGGRNAPPLPTLTLGEAQILELICAGLTDAEIACRRNISVATTKAHIRDLLRKLKVQRRSQAALWTMFVMQGLSCAVDIDRKMAALECGDNEQAWDIGGYAVPSPPLAPRDAHTVFCENYAHVGTEALTEREREVMRWTAEGKTAFEISIIIGLTERTVNFHIGRVLAKLGAINKTQAAVKAAVMGMLS